MTGKKMLIAAILLVSAVMLMAGCAGQSNTVKAGDNVTIDFTQWLDDGSILDTSNASVAYQEGIYNPNYVYAPVNITAGEGDLVSEGVTGMKVNETKNITIEAKDAFGEYDPLKIQPVNMSVLTAANITPVVNDTLFYNMEPVTVVGIENNTTVMIDFNHPFAGHKIYFMVTVLAFETPATPKNSS